VLPLILIARVRNYVVCILAVLTADLMLVILNFKLILVVCVLRVAQRFVC